MIKYEKEAEILTAFDSHKKRVARDLIDFGEGKRVARVVGQMQYREFKAGWQHAKS